MAITADAVAAWKEEKETMTADAEKTGTGIRIADAETEETEIMTVTVVTEETETTTVTVVTGETGIRIAAVDQSAVNQGWIPAPLFLFQVREPAAVKVHRVMTDGI